MKEKEYFKGALINKKVPILVLDQKWHRLFAIHGKSDEIQSTEEELDHLIARQGQANQDIKDLKKVKASLMESIVAHMDESDDILFQINPHLFDPGIDFFDCFIICTKFLITELHAC